MAEELRSTAFERYHQMSRRGRAGPQRRTAGDFLIYPASLAMSALLLWIVYQCLNGVAQCIVRAVELLNGS